jgi:hypothetical protein
MVDFLVHMCTFTRRFTRQYMIVDRKRRALEGMELLYHWMFHVWGFGSRVPQADRLMFKTLREVERVMSAFRKSDIPRHLMV